jgi:glycosyltransferase involved in cell wall biosynthesis
MFKDKKVLMLSYNEFFSDGRALRFTDAVNELFEVFVLSYGNNACEENVRGVFLRIPRNRFFRHVKFLWYALYYSIRIRPYAIFSLNFYTLLPGFLSSRLSRSFLIYDNYELIIPGSFSNYTRRDYFFFNLEKMLISSADLVFCASEARARFMRRMYRIKNITSVYNIPKFEISDFTLREKSCNLIYQGDVNVDRHLDKFIESLEFLPKEFNITIVGDGPDLDNLKKLVLSLQLEHRVKFCGRIENSKMYKITQSCTIGFIGYPFLGFNNKYCSPNKVFEYSQNGLVFLTSSQYFLREIVDRYHIGLYYDENADAKVMASLLLDLFENLHSYQKGMKEFVTDYSYSLEKERVLERLNDFM